ncbi:MAG: LysM peptidoglycan-binding domain-containing protein [Flavobacteriales bacterium]
MKKTNEILKGLVVIIAFLVVMTTFAQVDSLPTDSFKVHIIKGKDYYIHIVEKGNSLYAIHKKYNVPLDIIRKENPSVLDGLSIGEKIFIPVKKRVKYKVKTNGNFINHTVKKKQTLYAISKLYEVKQQAIVAANPDLVDGLKDGQEIKIPVLNIKKKEAPKTIVQDHKYQTHKIERGETFYSLSKLYKIPIDSIKLINGGLEQGLKKGALIYIPFTHNEKGDTSGEDTSVVGLMPKLIDSILLDTIHIVRKNEYKIGLFLPFYLDVNYEKSVYPKSKFAIEFYNGVKMALDSISTDRCKFKLYVYDTNGDDTLRIKNLLLQQELAAVDLIIGPLYFNNFKLVAKFAQNKQIPIVSPVKQSNKLLLDNPFVFKAIPSKSTTLKEMCTLVVDSFKTEHLLAVSYRKAKERLLVNSYIKTYNEKILNSEDTIIYSAIKTLDISFNINTIVSHLHPTKNNVIFVPTTDQFFVTNLFRVLTTTLNKKSYKDYRVTLLGLEEWMNFENIDLSYFQILNVHYCSARFINDEGSLVKSFVKKYVKQKETYPSKNTFLGFDLGYCFGNNLIHNGILFSAVSLKEFKGLSINLKFFKTGLESGFENTNSFLLRFDDYMLKSAN